MTIRLVPIADARGQGAPFLLVRGYLHKGQSPQRGAWLRAIRQSGYRGAVYEVSWDASTPKRFATNVIGFRDWRQVKGRARQVGRELLPKLLNESGWTGVTLIGASAGARIVYHALHSGALNEAVVEHAVLLGGAIRRDGHKDWQRAVDSVSGKLVNVYSRRDAVLATVYRAAAKGGLACGTGPIEVADERIVNVDATDLVRGGFLHLAAHGRYNRALAEKVTAAVAAPCPPSTASQPAEATQPTEQPRPALRSSVRHSQPPKPLSADQLS